MLHNSPAVLQTSKPSQPAAPIATPKEMYLDLLKKCLTRYLFGERYQPLSPGSGPARLVQRLSKKLLRRRKLEIVRRVRFDPDRRYRGLDWPAEAETMVGLLRLDNLQQCVVQVLRDQIPGDLIETGVWRGGAAILMRAVLAAYGDDQRSVWLADSFRGLPRPDAERYPADADDPHWRYPELAVPLDEVKENFARYGLLDDRVRFLEGWFSKTLPQAPIERLAILRMDGDMYESTMDAMTHLYPKVSAGGFVIVDDYYLDGCRKAVDDYRQKHSISEEIFGIDQCASFWRKRQSAD